MDNTAYHISPDPLDIIGRKLDELLANVASLSERQQVNDEIMVELVTFFQRFREETLESHQVNLDELRHAAQAVIVKTSDLAQSSAKLTEAVATGLKEIGARNEKAASEHHRVLRHLAQSGLRKIPVASAKIRCVFLVHVIESWDAQLDIYRAMEKDDRFDPIAVSINRLFPGENTYSGESAISEALTKLSIEHVRIGTPNKAEAEQILHSLAPDVIFRQSEWDRDYPPAFRESEIAFARHVIVPYGMSIVKKFSHSENVQSEISPMAFDQPYHRTAWRVFCENNITQSYYRSFKHSDPNKFVLTGYPKYERLAKFKGTEGAWPIELGGNRRYRIIWAPHHSVGNDWLAFGVFHHVYLKMLDWAKNSPDMEFVLKPHPALFPLLTSMGLVSKAALDDFKLAWNTLPNCMICDGQYGDLFAASDIMLTDGMSFLTEYQLFDKPLVFIDSQRHVPLNELGELAVSCADTVTSFEDARAMVTAYAQGKQRDNAEALSRLIETVLPNKYPAAEVILDSIAEGLGKTHRSSFRDIAANPA